MKFIMTIFLLVLTFSAHGQNNAIKVSDFKVTMSLFYVVNSSKELETIDWNQIKDNFKENHKDEIIELTFGLNEPNAKNNFKSSFKVSGDVKNIDSLIKQAKKGIKSIIKLSKKYNNSYYEK